ncbi:MAG TPA: hypothetical protein VG817_00500 [Gemmatimonadales bacterium]|nr:hypothetical protein [Gemmatimonadales bacterium]
MPRTAFLLLAGLAVGHPTLAAQTTKGCDPAADRAGRTLGCYVTLRQELGRLPRDTAIYWYIDSLADSSTYTPPPGTRSAVVHSLGATWLFTIGPAGLPSRAGRRVYIVGPFPLVQADSFTATYMEGVFTPGMITPAHRHPGAEGWYTVQGTQCLETPSGITVQRAGEGGGIAIGGVPMQLSGVGTEIRRSLVLILQDASQPLQSPATDWTPKGLCRNL